MDKRADLMALIDTEAAVVWLPDKGIYIGVGEMDGRRCKRAAFVVADLARQASDLLGLTAPLRRSGVVAAVARTSWQRASFSANGRERRWFTTEEMATAILLAADVCCYCATGDAPLRPYGPSGVKVCHGCAHATPEREHEVEVQFGLLSEAAQAASPLNAAVLTPDGPQPVPADPTEMA